MGEKIYRKEANRIVDELLVLEKEKKLAFESLSSIFLKLLNPQYYDKKEYVFVYIPQILYQLGYDIVSVDPFVLKKKKN